MSVYISEQFDEILEGLGQNAADFFLAASLYHAGHVSFERAAALAGLNLEAFHYRLQEHFGHGFALVDEVVRGDIQTARELSGKQ
jgi:predicted HTH domain antitoxin